MKFNFKIQQYQTDAVDAVVKVFNGQGFGSILTQLLKRLSVYGFTTQTEPEMFAAYVPSA